MKKSDYSVELLAIWFEFKEKNNATYTNVYEELLRRHPELRGARGFGKTQSMEFISKLVQTAENNRRVSTEQTTFKRMFVDIETSPNIVYSWRAGYKLNISTESIIQERRIICISWKWEGEDVVHNLTWDKDQDDKTMLEKFIPELDKADEVVAHNGARFDLPWIRTRCLYHRIPCAPYYTVVDTLKKVRGKFYFNSNRLDYLGEFLGVGRKSEMHFSDWKAVMNGDKQALEKMVHYCDQDVVLLEDVFTVLCSYIKHDSHRGVFEGGEKWSCPECGSQHVELVKTRVTPAGYVKREMKCTSCGKRYSIANRTYLNMLEELVYE